MNATARYLTIGLFVLAACGLAWADEPLRVYTSGAPGATVYVTPEAAISAQTASDSDVGFAAFSAKYCRGKAPLQVNLPPGRYMVSVMPSADYSMRDGMMKVAEFVWDGYDYHALIDQHNTRWRYAQCYLIEKVKGLSAEVLAVFTSDMTDGVATSYDMGKKATRFSATDEAGGQLLDEAKVPPSYSEDVLKGVRAGAKVIIREGAERWVITADGPEKLKIIRGHGSGAWATHRLSICSGDSGVF